MSSFGVDTSIPTLLDQIEHEQAYCGEDFTDQTFFRYEQPRPSKCALVVDGVTADLSVPRRLPSPRFLEVPRDPTHGQALTAFMDALLERRELSIVPKRRGKA